MNCTDILAFLKSGGDALEKENYLSALCIALILPSMCSRLEYKSKNPSDKKNYINWCNTYITQNEWLKDFFGNNYSEILYKLRCGIIHEGYAEINNDGKNIYLSYGNNCAYATFEKQKVISVELLCKSIFQCANLWCQANMALYNKESSFILNMKNPNDSLFLTRLYIEELDEKAKSLEE